jgi:hypothetical protein
LGRRIYLIGENGQKCKKKCSKILSAIPHSSRPLCVTSLSGWITFQGNRVISNQSSIQNLWLKETLRVWSVRDNPIFFQKWFSL